ncbi:MAG TPA: hypothetical protein VH639_19920 [Bryobacteraceae bacterium]|jgi:hypothetical protein
MWTATLALFCLCVQASPAENGDDAAAIMAKVAANVEKSAEARRQFVYRQTIKASLIRQGGQVARRERREYTVTPEPNGTGKKLVSFEGEYRKGKAMVAYSEPGFKYKDEDIDGELLGNLVDELTGDKDSRDGISLSLFPLRTKVLRSYKFSMNGQTNYQGRSTYRILFEPAAKGSCTLVSEESVCGDQPWKGEAWIDVADLAPVRIDTDLAFKVPWGVRVFLGTNVRQVGFSISYERVAEGVWFPRTYGTEFKLDVLWFYKRTVTLSLENSGFQKTEASSTITYNLPDPAPDGDSKAK